MASIVEENGKFRAYLCVAGSRYSETFPTKKKAQSWALEKEADLRKQHRLKRTRSAIIDDSFTLGKLFKKYASEVSMKKKGSRWELIRLAFYQKSFPHLCALKLTDLEHEDIQDWINERLEAVKPSTVNRDLNLISHCLTKARKWRLMSHKPFENVERPENPDHRRRLIEQSEIDAICEKLGYKENIKLKQKKQFVALVWLFAMETCMRCGEITGLNLKTIDFEKSIAHLPDTKNGSARNVPLSPKALALLDQLPTPPNDRARIFQVTSSSVDSLFRRYRDQTDIQDLVFHDSRHEAITRLVDTGKYNVFEVASITGHKDINELLTYYNKSAAQMAKEMASEAKQKNTDPLVDLTGIGDAGQVVGLKDLIKEILAEQAKIAA